MQSPVAGLDVEQLKAEISKTYTAVSSEPERDFIFPTGRAWARISTIPPTCWRACPRRRARRSPASRTRSRSGRSQPGEDVLDLGSGAGDGQPRGRADGRPDGSVTGIDMTPAMLDGRAARPQRDRRGNVTLRRGAGRGPAVRRRLASTS